MEVLRFSVGSSRYAFPLAQVVEVGPLPGLTLVPGGPPELAGVVNVRGEIVCALDLQRTVGLPVSATPPPAGSLLLMRARSRLVGLPVSSLTGVSPCDPDALLPLQGLNLAVAPFALGMLDDGVLLLAWLKIIRLALFDAL
jgi:purine-binding chemotaxis protein CheW